MIATAQLPDEVLRAAIEATDEGVVLVDGEQPGNPVVWLNAAFERICGFGLAQLAGGNLRVLHGGDRQQPALAELSAAMREERSCSVLLRNYRPDGVMFWNALRIVPCRDAQGHLWWLGFARDVSAQRDMEIMLGRRTDELDEARQQLVEVDPTDRLTGLRSEHSFELTLELAWFSCVRDRRSLALFLFAPDFFDAYLETFGRVAGDSSLRMVARSMGAEFRRASDVTARLGDAQFAALGINMERDMLEPHARRVSNRVRDLAIRNPHAPPLRMLTLGAVVLLAHPVSAGDWRAFLEDAKASLAATQGAGIEQVAVRDYNPPDQGFGES